MPSPSPIFFMAMFTLSMSVVLALFSRWRTLRSIEQPGQSAFSRGTARHGTQSRLGLPRR